MQWKNDLTDEEKRQQNSRNGLTIVREANFPGGQKIWFIVKYHMGKTVSTTMHRLDGPAIIYANGTEHWIVQGESIDIDAFAEKFGLTLPLDDEGIAIFATQFG
jgi:hypothetical protein